MKFNRENIDNITLIELYQNLLLSRLIEDKMIHLLRQGKISKWFSGIGQEAISAGSVFALNDDEYILPLIRNLGIFLGRKVSLKKLFSQFQGKENGFTKGRDRSFHFGTKEHHIVGMMSHLGPQLAVADGIALFNKLKKEKKVTVVFSGDGGTSEGDFHEGINVAAVWDLPVIFIVENNGYALSTPTNEQFRCQQLIDKAIGYGIEGERIDGNNVLEVYSTIKYYTQKIRKKPKPIMIEAMTFRMRGHEEASGTKYITKNLFDEWKEKDPIVNYENFLKEIKLIDDDFISQLKNELQKRIDYDWELSEREEEIQADIEKELNDVYAPFKQKIIYPITEKKTNRRFIDAIHDALKLALEKYPDLILMGQDIAEYSGAFKVTEGLINQFGKERIRNTPLCESAIIGTALGYAIKEGKSIVEMQFADFVTMGFNQIVNNLAKIYYRWGQNADVVIRMPTGAGTAAGPFHSQSNEAWFFHTPGLKIVYPSNPYDAKGLLLSSIEDPNPVMFFEHKFLYRSIHEDISDDYYTVEIGKAKVVNEGNDILIITYGLGVHWALEIIMKEKISATIIDLRTLLPFDKETIENYVKKIGKVIILHEDSLTGGIGAEISAFISENYFEYLDAPIYRVGSLDSPVPFAKSLEDNFLPKERFRKILKKLIEY